MKVDLLVCEDPRECLISINDIYIKLPKKKYDELMAKLKEDASKQDLDC